LSLYIKACRFLVIVINHWAKHSLPSPDLEDILEKHRSSGPWVAHLNCAVKEVIATADDRLIIRVCVTVTAGEFKSEGSSIMNYCCLISAEWIAANLTPLFILGAIKESHSPLSKVPDSSTKVVGSVVLASLSPSSNGQVSDSDASSSENIAAALNRSGKVNGRE
jgi:hypothetical protein